MDYAELPPTIRRRKKVEYKRAQWTFDGMFYRRMLIDGIGLANVCKKCVYEADWYGTSRQLLVNATAV